MKIFVTSIDTNVGKTIASSVLCSGLGYNYWKPVQCGDLDQSDSIRVQELSPNTFIHKESFRLTQPMSPHQAAYNENVEIKLNDFELPKEDKIIIEGAGGVMVPLNYKGDVILDLAKKFNTKMIVVFKNYLGSINHTILTIEKIKYYGLPIIGLIVVGDRVESSESIIQKVTKTKIIGHLPFCDNIDAEWVQAQGQTIAHKLGEDFKL